MQQPTEADALRAEVAALTEKLRDGKSHICAIPHEHRGCAFCQRDEAREEVAALKQRWDYDLKRRGHETVESLLAAYDDLVLGNLDKARAAMKAWVDGNEDPLEQKLRYFDPHATLAAEYVMHEAADELKSLKQQLAEALAATKEV